MKKAHGTEKLCVQIEDLLTAPYITRDEFSRIYRAVNDTFSEQAEGIIDRLFAEKVGEKLRGLGYSLIDENGKPVDIPADKICTLSTPYEGYQVRIKVGRNKNIATRLVRVVGSNEEKANVSEYQKQKDIETGRKLCKDLRAFYKSLENDGIKMNDVMRKEPEEENLDIIVDASSAVKVRSSSFVQDVQEQKKLRNRSV